MKYPDVNAAIIYNRKIVLDAIFDGNYDKAIRCLETLKIIHPKPVQP